MKLQKIWGTMFGRGAPRQQMQNFAFHFYTRNFPILQKITMFATLKKIQ